MPPIDDEEYEAIIALTRSQDADRRDRHAALRELAGLPCPHCLQIDTPLPGTPPLRLTLRRRHGRLFLDCPRRHEFTSAAQVRAPS